MASRNKKTSDLIQVVRVWIPAAEIQWVLSLVIRHMTKKAGTTEYANPAISEFRVLDDRGGSGHYWIHFDEDEVTVAEAKRIVGKDFEVSLENK